MRMDQEKGMAGLTEMALWSFLQPGAHQKPNIAALKEAVNDLCQMTMQKTAGQRKNGKCDISWDNLERVKFTIICEATLLVLSGRLDESGGG